MRVNVARFLKCVWPFYDIAKLRINLTDNNEGRRNGTKIGSTAFIEKKKTVSFTAKSETERLGQNIHKKTKGHSHGHI